MARCASQKADKSDQDHRAGGKVRLVCERIEIGCRRIREEAWDVSHEEPARNRAQAISLAAAPVTEDVMLSGHRALLRKPGVRRQGRNPPVAFEWLVVRIARQSPSAEQHTEDMQPCWK